MRRVAFVGVALMSAFGQLAHGAAEGVRDPVRLTLNSAKPEYVLGEPVVLDLTVENIGQSPVHTWVAPLSYQISFLIGPGEIGLRGEMERAGCKGMERVDLFCGTTIRLITSWASLEPGTAKRYRFRLLTMNYFDIKAAVFLTRLGKAGEIPQCRLVCDRPGEYVVMAQYPLHIPKVERQRLFYSNVERFRVRWPEPGSQKVWDRINRWEFLGFLQSPGPLDWQYGVSPEIVDLAVDVLRKSPDSEYSPAIRVALRHYYAHRGDTLSSPEGRRRLEKVREVLQVPKRAVYSLLEDKYYVFPREGEEPGGRLFPDDPRLERMVEVGPVTFCGLPTLLHQYEIQRHGVPLRIAPAIESDYELVLDAPIRQTLREFMAHVAVPGTKWVKDGDGYKLVPAPQERKKE